MKRRENIFRITFCGSRTVDNKKIKTKLFELLYDMLIQPPNVHDCIEFFCGGDGEFDGMASEAIDRIRKCDPDLNIHKVLVLPYCTPEYLEKAKLVAKHYDELYHPPLCDVPNNRAVEERNKWMIRKSDFLIVYIHDPTEPAAEYVKYAESVDTAVLSLSDES